MTKVAIHRRWHRRIPWLEDGLSRELIRLRWLAIVAPITFLTVVVYLLRGPFHEEFHSYPGIIYLLLVLAAGVLMFSFVIFALIGSVERQVMQRNRELEALLAVGRAASSSLRLSDMLDAALDAILVATSAEAAEVWLLEGNELLLERQRGLDAEAFRERTRLRLGDGLPGIAAESGQPLFVHDLSRDARVVRRRIVELGFESFGALPLMRGGETVGVLGVAARDRSALSGRDDRRLLEGIGEQVAVAIENARLHVQVLDAAVIEERERLARELHDSVGQVLGYVNTQTLAIKGLLATDRRDEAEKAVAEMERTARRVYTDVREAILELRTGTDDMLASLRSYASEFGRLTDIHVLVEVDERIPLHAVRPTAEIQLVRIVQEALANVRKHAHASNAWVRVRTDGDHLVVAVRDDGRGFDADRPYRTGWPRFGLQTMRERADAIGGRLEISSTPGSGTQVIVRVPLATSDVVSDHVESDASSAR